MSEYSTKKAVVQAVRFEQHRKPWPEAVEAVYTHGIPEPRLEGGSQVVANGDWVVRAGTLVFTMPHNVFTTLFRAGGPVEDTLLAVAMDKIVFLERELNARLAAERPDPDIALSPDPDDTEEDQV